VLDRSLRRASLLLQAPCGSGGPVCLCLRVTPDAPVPPACYDCSCESGLIAETRRRNGLLPSCSSARTSAESEQHRRSAAANAFVSTERVTVLERVVVVMY